MYRKTVLYFDTFISSAFNSLFFSSVLHTIQFCKIGFSKHNKYRFLKRMHHNKLWIPINNTIHCIRRRKHKYTQWDWHTCLNYHKADKKKGTMHGFRKKWLHSLEEKRNELLKKLKRSKCMVSHYNDKTDTMGYLLFPFFVQERKTQQFVVKWT